MSEKVSEWVSEWVSNKNDFEWIMGGERKGEKVNEWPWEWMNTSMVDGVYAWVFMREAAVVRTIHPSEGPFLRHIIKANPHDTIVVELSPDCVVQKLLCVRVPEQRRHRLWPVTALCKMSLKHRLYSRSISIITLIMARSSEQSMYYKAKSPQNCVKRNSHRAVFTFSMTHDLEWTIALNDCLSESSCTAEKHFRSTGLARKLETALYNTAELIEARQFVAALMYRESARDKGVNRCACFVKVALCGCIPWEEKTTTTKPKTNLKVRIYILQSRDTITFVGQCETNNRLSIRVRFAK